MTQLSRQERLRVDQAALRALQLASTILDFTATGDPPDRYVLTFRGRGLRRELTAQAGMGQPRVVTTDLHECELRMPLSYPERPPDIRWITPLFHPNVSFSGFLGLADIGLSWSDNLQLDIIVERLWNVARLAYVDLDRATNYGAKSWLERENTQPLPLDPRPIRDKIRATNPNVIQYQRRGQRTQLVPPAGATEELFFIGEDTPTPVLRLGSRRRHVVTDPGDDDILFIE